MRIPLENRRLTIAVAVAVLLVVLLAVVILGERERDHLTLYGNVDIRQVELGFRVGGRIAEMNFEEGDRVAAGTVLARLDDRPFQDDFRQYAAAVDAEAANLEKLTRGTRPEEIAEARALVDERRATLTNAERLLKRREELIETGAVSQAAFDDARAAVSEATARVIAANKSLELALNGARIEDITQATAQLNGAKARLAAAETALADTELTAPTAGVILSRIREPGAIVSPGMPVYTLSLTEPVWVRAYVAEPDLGRIYPGMPAAVHSDSQPDRAYAGQIGFISPVAEFTPKAVETPDLRSDLVYRLRIIVTDPDQGLRQGMPVTVRLEIGDREQAAAERSPAPGAKPAPESDEALDAAAEGTDQAGDGGKAGDKTSE